MKAQDSKNCLDYKYQEMIIKFEEIDRPDLVFKVKQKMFEGDPHPGSLQYFACYHFQRGNIEAAIAYSKEEFEKTGDLKALIQMGNYYFKMKFYQKAIDSYQKALEKGQKLGRWMIGLIHEETGNFPLALQYYLKYLQISKEFNEENFVIIGGLLMKMGEIDHAMGYYQIIVKRDNGGFQLKEVAMAHFHVGKRYLLQKKIHAAIVSLQRSAKIDPTQQEVFVNLGLAKRFEHGWDKSVSYYRKALQMNQGCYLAHFYLAFTFFHTEQISLAIKSFKKISDQWVQEQSVRFVILAAINQISSLLPKETINFMYFLRKECQNNEVVLTLVNHIQNK